MKSNRRQDILEALARELESNPGDRLTTAALARAVGVSEAALYRHFPSKARMFEALIEFAEDAVFGLFNRILEEEREAPARCRRMLGVLFGFAERNPGIARILVGDILLGEHARLRARVNQFFDRVETQLRTILREAALGTGPGPHAADVAAAAGLLGDVALGRLNRYVRGGFKSAVGGAAWEEEWRLIRGAVFAAGTTVV
ncbi:MAG: nucleoid occlusion factor SlmA [Gammaproteobacteria bacterium]|nr:nucleoid occlusion factor SlmA [Gammaproteobacteria bacterium]MBI5616369.1 nucleoid occlusion factor SlmA [Gammaproteobacteria bacterium]